MRIRKIVAAISMISLLTPTSAALAESDESRQAVNHASDVDAQSHDESVLEEMESDYQQSVSVFDATFEIGGFAEGTNTVEMKNALVGTSDPELISLIANSRPDLVKDTDSLPKLSEIDSQSIKEATLVQDDESSAAVVFPFSSIGQVGRDSNKLYVEDGSVKVMVKDLDISFELNDDPSLKTTANPENLQLFAEFSGDEDRDTRKIVDDGAYMAFTLKNSQMRGGNNADMKSEKLGALYLTPSSIAEIRDTSTIRNDLNEDVTVSLGYYSPAENHEDDMIDGVKDGLKPMTDKNKTIKVENKIESGSVENIQQDLKMDVPKLNEGESARRIALVRRFTNEKGETAYPPVVDWFMISPVIMQARALNHDGSSRNLKDSGKQKIYSQIEMNNLMRGVTYALVAKVYECQGVGKCVEASSALHQIAASAESDAVHYLAAEIDNSDVPKGTTYEWTFDLLVPNENDETLGTVVSRLDEHPDELVLSPESSSSKSARGSLGTNSSGFDPESRLKNVSGITGDPAPIDHFEATVRGLTPAFAIPENATLQESQKDKISLQLILIALVLTCAIAAYTTYSTRRTKDGKALEE